MPDSATATYGFIQPEDAGSQHTWEPKINAGWWDKLDAAIKKVDPNQAAAKSAPAVADSIGMHNGVDNDRVTWNNILASLDNHFDARYALATIEEAEEGTDNVKRITPLLMAASLDALGPNPNDQWGSQKVEHDLSLTGQGTAGDPLKRYIPPAPTVDAISPSVYHFNDNMTVSGTGLDGATIQIFDGAVLIDTATVSGTTWSKSVAVPDAAGAHTIKAKQLLHKGLSVFSNSRSITVVRYSAPLTSLTSSTLNPTNPSLVVNWLTNGNASYSAVSGPSGSANYVVPVSFAASSHIRFVPAGGDTGQLGGSALNTWHALSSTRTLSLSRTSFGTSAATVTVQYSFDGGVTVAFGHSLTLTVTEDS